MFTQNCFIRKNTKELRKKLKSIGYLDNTCFTCFDNFLYTLGDNYYTCKNYDKFSKLRSKEFVHNECIDCGTNEDLFLAIAALRDNSDYMQWFCDCDDRFWKCNELVEDGKNSWNHGEHKATVEELIEYFQTK